MHDQNQCYPALLALGLTLIVAAPTASFAASDAGGSAAAYSANSDVLSDRRCKRGPKQEICDWAKRDHKTTAGH